MSARSEYFARKVAGYTPAVDPQTQLPVDAGDRVKHWHAQSNALRAAARTANLPGHRDHALGFRVARSVPDSTA